MQHTATQVTETIYTLKGVLGQILFVKKVIGELSFKQINRMCERISKKYGAWPSVETQRMTYNV